MKISLHSLHSLHLDRFISIDNLLRYFELFWLHIHLSAPNTVWRNIAFLLRVLQTLYCPLKFSTSKEQWFEEKKEDIWLSHMTKAPKPTEKSRKQSDNTSTPPKTLTTKRLRTDLGRSVWVTIATQLVWLNRFTGSQPSH